MQRSHPPRPRRSPFLAVFAAFARPPPAGVGAAARPQPPAANAPAATVPNAPPPAPPVPQLGGGRRALSLDDVFGPVRPLESWGNIPYVTGWSADGKSYRELADNGAGEVQLMRVDADTGRAAPLYDAPRMEAAIAALPGMDMAAAHRLAYRESYLLDAKEARALLPHDGALLLYDFARGRAARLTAGNAKGAATEPSFSPDGRRVAFVRDNDLYTVDTARPGVETRLTTGGDARLLHGRLDWVYEEELYGRGTTGGYAWSPDGERIVFLRLDEKRVKTHTLVNTLPTEQAMEEQLYPRPGEPNPVATIGVAWADNRLPVKWLDTAVYPDDDRLIVRFAWSPIPNGGGARLTFQVQDRAQTFLDLLQADPNTGKTTRILRETTPRWVDVIGNPVWLRDGSFLWLSDRSGFRHLYRYQGDGKLQSQLTRGEWDIRTLHGADVSASYAYFSAGERTPLATHVYRLWLADPAAAAAPQRLTDAAGSHSARFDPTFTRFLDQWSGIEMPPRLRVANAATGKDVRMLGDSSDTVRQFAPFRFARAEWVTVKARDGSPLEAVLFRPPDFDPTKRYPVVCPVYGGPGSQSVKDEWAGRDFLMWQLLAQKGFVVWLCDNRSASGRGARSQWPIYKNLGAAELADIEDGLAYLRKQPWIDGARVGIGGWSYGGFLAQYALTHSKSFKAGVSAAGVSDWRLYDSIYTERYMDTPARNPDGYRTAAPAAAAADCAGRLLLLHGMMDNNVHFQNTARMAYALQRAGKRFDMNVYPGPDARHGFADAALDRHVYVNMVEFFIQNL